VRKELRTPNFESSSPGSRTSGQVSFLWNRSAKYKVCEYLKCPRYFLGATLPVKMAPAGFTESFEKFFLKLFV
jgi:hypothetical protein